MVDIVRDPGGRSAIRIGGAVMADDPRRASSAQITDLAEQVREAMHDYRVRSGGRRVAAVHLSGAGAATPGVEGAITSALRRPLRAVGLEQIVSTRGLRIPSEQALSLVSTVGILLGGRR